jgi:drug/metabolite transporter (DMT)-like permease
VPTTSRLASPASPAFGFAIVLVAATLFGTLGPVSRLAYDAGMEPGAFVAWRALIGLIALLTVVAWRVRRGGVALVRPGQLSGRVRVTLFVAAMSGFLLNLFMFIAFDLITVVLALLGFYTYPAMVAATNVALGRERLDSAKAVALVMALAGMVAVVASQLDPDGSIRFNVAGLALALAAAAAQTVFVVISRDGYRAVPAEQAMSVVLLVTLIGATILAALAGSPGALTLPVRDLSIVPLLLFAGIFAAAIPSLAFLIGIRAIGGTRAGILMLFEPVVGVALAAWILDEALVPIQIVGAVAILAAAVVLQRGAAEEVDPRDAAPVIIAGGP